MEKNLKKSGCVCVYIYIKRNHFAVHLKLTQHCKSTILQYKIKIKRKSNFEKVKVELGFLKLPRGWSNTWCYWRSKEEEKSKESYRYWKRTLLSIWNKNVIGQEVTNDLAVSAWGGCIFLSTFMILHNRGVQALSLNSGLECIFFSPQSGSENSSR